MTASLEPQTAKIAGAITSAAAPATSETTAPAIPIDFRNPSGKTVSVTSASATVTALKATVRPAVRTVVRTASGFSLRELLAEAGDEEERVVDRQPEAEPDHEVEREDRERVHLVDRRQREERAHHRGHPDHERQDRGAAAEEEQRQQEQDGEREHLRAPEVLGDGVADLVLREDRAAEQDVLVLEALLEAGDDVVLLRLGVEGREQIGLVPSRLSVGCSLTEAMPGWAWSWARTSAAWSGERISATTPGAAWMPVAASMRAWARAEPDSSR